MSSLLTPSHPAFALPRDTARSYLTWARRLAQLEAIVLLFATCSQVNGPAGGDANGVAIVSLAMAFLYLALGYYVGQGSPRAAVTLLALSIVRAVMAFLPGQTDLGVLVAPLLLADLFLFTQASRAAISLAQRAAVIPIGLREDFDSALAAARKPTPVSPTPVVPTKVAAAPVVATPVLSLPRPQTAIPIPAGTFKWPRSWEESPTVDPPSVNRNFTLDFIVASILLVISLAGLADALSLPGRGEGAAGLGALYGLAIAVWHLPMAGVLFLAARDSETKKFWARTPRVVVYFLLGTEVLQLLGIAFKFVFHRTV